MIMLDFQQRFFTFIIMIIGASLMAMENPFEIPLKPYMPVMPTVLTQLDSIRYPEDMISAFQKAEFLYLTAKTTNEAQKVHDILFELTTKDVVFPPALYLLGVIYLQGWCGSPDYALGEFYLWKSSKMNYPPALLYLSNSYAQRARNILKEENMMRYAVLSSFMQSNADKALLHTATESSQSQLASNFSMKKICNLIRCHQTKQASTLFETWIQDATPDALCAFIKSSSYKMLNGLFGNYMLGKFWQKMCEFTDENCSFILQAGDIDVPDDCKGFCTNQAYSFFNQAACKGHSSSWIELGNYIETNEELKEKTKKQAAACYYKAFLHGSNAVKEIAFQHLLNCAHLDDAEKADMQAINRLILACKKDQFLFQDYFKKILLKSTELGFYEKNEVVQLVRTQFPQLRNHEGYSDEIGYLFGKLLAESKGLKYAHEYLQPYASSNKIGLWYYCKKLVEAREFEDACQLLKKLSESCVDDMNTFNEPCQKYQEFVLNRLDSFSENNGLVSFLLGYLFADGNLVEENEKKALAYFNQSANLKYPKGLYARVLFEEDQEVSEHMFYDLLALLGTQFHDEYLIKRIIALIEQRHLSVEQCYELVMYAMDSEPDLALRAFEHAEECLMQCNTEERKQQEFLVYSTEAYKKLRDYAESGQMHVCKALARMHMLRAQNRYGLKATVLDEWRQAAAFLKQVAEGYPLSDQADLHKVNDEIFRLLEDEFEKRQMAENIMDFSETAKLWYQQNCLTQKVSADDENLKEEAISENISSFNKGVQLFNEQKFEEALEAFWGVQERVELIKTYAYQGLIHYENNHDLLSCLSLGWYLDKALSLEENESELTQKVYECFENLKNRNIFFGYHLMKYKLLETIAAKNYKHVRKIISKLKEIDEHCLTDQLIDEIFKNDLYGVFKELAETVENTHVRYNLYLFLFLVHAKRALWSLQHGKEWKMHVEKAQEYFMFVEKYKTSGSAVDDIIGGLQCLARTFIEGKEVQKADEYLHKMLFFDRKNEFAICNRMNLFLNYQSIDQIGKSSFQQALNDLNYIENSNNPVALQLLIQINGLAMEGVENACPRKYAKPNLNKGFNLLNKLASLELESVCVLNARKTLAHLYITGLNRGGLIIKKNIQKGIDIICSKKMDLFNHYRFELIQFLFECAAHENDGDAELLVSAALELCDKETQGDLYQSEIMVIELFKAKMLLKRYEKSQDILDAMNIIDKYAQQKYLAQSFSIMEKFGILKELGFLIKDSTLSFIMKTIGLIWVNAANLGLVNDRVQAFKEGERYLNLCYLSLKNDDPKAEAVILLYLAQVRLEPYYINFADQREAYKAITISLNRLSQFFKMDQNILEMYASHAKSTLFKMRYYIERYLNEENKALISARMLSELPCDLY